MPVDTCQVLDPVENGIWHIEGFHPGSIAKLSCKDGFTLAVANANFMKVCKDNGDWLGDDSRCISNTEAASIAEGGLPLLIIVITLVLCALLLTTIILVIVILVYRRKKHCIEDCSPGPEPKICFGAFGKPLTGRPVEIQPDLGNLEPRLDPHAYVMQYGQLPPRRFVSLPLESQRRLIPVPEEDGDGELTSPDRQYILDQSEMEIEANLQDWTQAYGPLIPPVKKGRK